MTFEHVHLAAHDRSRLEDKDRPIDLVGCGEKDLKKRGVPGVKAIKWYPFDQNN